jgi:hypothetical protein
VANATAKVNVGTVGIICPVCGEEIPVTVTATMLNPEKASDGSASLVCEPDTTDMWAHMWSHEEFPRD